MFELDIYYLTFRLQAARLPNRRPWFESALRLMSSVAPLDIFSCVCGNQNWICFKVGQAISGRVCGVKTRYFEVDFRTFPAMFVTTKTGILNQTMSFF